MTAERQTAVRPAPVRIRTPATFGVLQRKCACGGSSGAKGECEECGKKAVSLQRRASGAAAPAMAPPIVHDVLRSPGQPLDRATRSVMEPMFGHDFSRVRVHADSRAAESAQAVGAKAYAVANQVVFNRGEYEPGSANGLGSLAHELTHVVQQTSGGAGTIPQHIPIGEPGAPEEREAEQVAGGGWLGTAVSNRDHAGLRRQPEHKEGEPEREPQKDPEKASDDDPPPLIKLPHPFDGLDPKIFVPGPIDAPSLEDIHKGLWKLQHPGGSGGSGNPKCPPGWRMLKTGDCCEGSSVDPRHCCSPDRLTILGRCCPTGEHAQGSECVKSATTTPKGPVNQPPGPGTPQPRPRGPLPGPKLPPGPPLTISLDILFKQDRPGGIVGDDKALRDSLTVSGGATLDNVVAWLKKDPKYAVQLTGSASIEGPAAHNRELGERRAWSIASVLAHQGFGRIEDPPGLPAPCARLGDGIHNCGDTLSSKTIDDRDRRVRATLFIPPGRP